MTGMKQKIVLNTSILYCSFLFLTISFVLLTMPIGLCAQEIPADKKEVFSVSGLPIPRFVSLSSKLTNVRAGPGQHYPIRWVYKKQGLPVEVILEYDHWRKIRDHEGSEGWVYKTLLSGDRTALIKGSETVQAYDRNPVEKPQKARVVMRLEPMSLVGVRSCDGLVCYIEVSNLSGWIERKSLWGVYEAEKFD